jgi:hypothetical protein
MRKAFLVLNRTLTLELLSVVSVAVLLAPPDYGQLSVLDLTSMSTVLWSRASSGCAVAKQRTNVLIFAERQRVAVNGNGVNAASFPSTAHGSR